MAISKRWLSAAALVALAPMVFSACGNSSNGGQNPDGSTTMTMWHNATTGEGKQYWDDTAAAFSAANPGVTIETQAIQNEEFDGKLQTALNSGDAPDIFFARGGGKLAAMVEAGQVMDITDKITPESKAVLGASLGAFAIDNVNYGVPVSVAPSGIYTADDLLKAAGVATPITTIAELEAATAKIKATGVAPIAVGAKDAWPAAHWYFNFALRACSKDVLEGAMTNKSFDDPCWLTAGQNLESFLQTKPFNEGFLTTAAQQGAGSSAGLVANHKAAMELMGAWNPGVIADLTPNQEPLPDLGWFPFPEVPGGQGAPGAIMGGVDGFSCSTNAPPACTQFLNFILTKENQEGFATAFKTIPASTEATGAVTLPPLKSALQAYKDAPYVMLWLDTLYGQNVGNALNVAVVDMFAGKGNPQAIVDAVTAAAKRS